ncbi:MAG: pyruvate kinase, partial [Okeania sp. SIO2D1]|nr:pyruvate kinase [Okeania sp. SIO2D1]
MEPLNLQHKTKIVATVGPATSQPDVLRRLIEAGATTLRLNFSHGTHEDHQRNIRLIRQTAFELNTPVGILQDLQGPKIRLGKFEHGSINLKRGDLYTLTSRRVNCSQEIGYVSYKNLVQEIPEGANIMLDDGKVEMKVEKIDLQQEQL